MVSIKNPSPALPTANNTVSHVPTPGSQPQALTEPTAITSPLSSAGVAYAIISTSSSNAATIAPSTTVSVVHDSTKVQPLLISADSQVGAHRPVPGRPRGLEQPGGGRMRGKPCERVRLQAGGCEGGCEQMVQGQTGSE